MKGKNYKMVVRPAIMTGRGAGGGRAEDAEIFTVIRMSKFRNDYIRGTAQVEKVC